MVWSDLSLAEPEPFKSEVNREVGKAVSARSGKSLTLRSRMWSRSSTRLPARSKSRSTRFSSTGRYQKFERGIPQTHWDCRACRGKGCEKCNFTGAQYLDSVEELNRQAGHRGVFGEERRAARCGPGGYRRPDDWHWPAVHPRSRRAEETVDRSCLSRSERLTGPQKGGFPLR